jgi:hypothetical protein
MEEMMRKTTRLDECTPLFIPPIAAEGLGQSSCMISGNGGKLRGGGLHEFWDRLIAAMGAGYGA